MQLLRLVGVYRLVDNRLGFVTKQQRGTEKKTLNKMKMKQMRANGFTLVEIMIVVAIIGLLIAVAVPNFSKMRKDAQKTACHAQLKQIDGSKEMWATQEKRADGDTPSDSQLGVYFKDGMPTCPGGGSYTIGPVGSDASCTVHQKTLQ